jgi:hypothetical protein
VRGLFCPDEPLSGITFDFGAWIHTLVQWENYHKIANEILDAALLTYTPDFAQRISLFEAGHGQL